MLRIYAEALDRLRVSLNTYLVVLVFIFQFIVYVFSVSCFQLTVFSVSMFCSAALCITNNNKNSVQNGTGAYIVSFSIFYELRTTDRKQCILLPCFMVCCTIICQSTRQHVYWHIYIHKIFAENAGFNNINLNKSSQFFSESRRRKTQ